MKAYRLILVAMLASGFVFADEPESVRDFAKRLNADKRGNISTHHGTLVEKGVKGVSDSALPQKNLNASELSDPDARPDLIDEAGRGAKATQGNMPDAPDVKNSDFWLRRARTLEEAPQEKVDFDDYMSRRYSDCRAQTIAVEGTRSAICDEYISGGDSATCAIGRRVEVDADHTYRCTQDSPKTAIACTRQITTRCRATFTPISDAHNANTDFTIALNPSFACPDNDADALFTTTQKYLYDTRAGEWIETYPFGLSAVTGFKPKIIQCRYEDSSFGFYAGTRYIVYYAFALTRKSTTKISAHYHTNWVYGRSRNLPVGSTQTLWVASNTGTSPWNMNWGEGNWARSYVRVHSCTKWQDTQSGESCG